MLKVIEFNGKPYKVKNQTRMDWIRFEWDHGYLEITKDRWSHIPEYKRELVYSLVKEEGYE